MTIFATLSAALTTPGLIGLIALVVFLIVLAVRKSFGQYWERFASLVSPDLDQEVTAGSVVLSKFVQGLPAVIIGAVIGAATSGAALAPTLLSALAGALAVFGHELAKAIPIIPYTGSTGTGKNPVIPKSPNLPTGVATLAFMLMLAAMVTGCPAATPEPCSPSQKSAIEAKFVEEVAIKCAAYDDTSKCPEYPAIKAERAKAEVPCR